MKRNKNLIELSRDHHHGLLLGWKIREGFKRNVAVNDVLQYITHFAAEALFPHFEEEENQVLVFLSEENELRKQVLKEHQEIREMIEICGVSNNADKLLQLASKLDAHIRFEERELFPYMEKVLSDQELDELGDRISAVHQPYTEMYPNEFWR